MFYITKKADLNESDQPFICLKPLFWGWDYFLYPSSCTLLTDRPEGSFRFLKAASHSKAIGVLQATEGTEGTHNEAASEGKKSVKIVR